MEYSQIEKGFGLNADMIIHMPYLVKRAKKASYIIEIGVYRGEGSTAALSYGLNLSKKQDKLMISIDLEDRMIFKPTLNYWSFLQGNSMNIYTVYDVKRISANRVPDIIYIDTTHNYNQLKKELCLWKDIIGEETILIFHDIWMEGKYNPMSKAIQELSVEKNWVFEIITKESCGLGILYNPENKIMREELLEIMENKEPWRYK